MKRIKRAVVGLIVGVMMTFGIGVIAAPAAQAYSDGGWYFHYNCMPYPSGAFQWRDYNWWEEAWGARDGYVWKYNFYNYC